MMSLFQIVDDWNVGMLECWMFIGVLILVILVIGCVISVFLLNCDRFVVIVELLVQDCFLLILVFLFYVYDFCDVDF